MLAKSHRNLFRFHALSLFLAYKVSKYLRKNLFVIPKKINFALNNTLISKDMKPFRNLAGIFLGLFLTTFYPTDMNAQDNFTFWWTERQSRQNAEQMQLRTQQMLDTRKDHLQTLPIEQLLNGDDDCTWWWDGQHIYSLGYEGEHDEYRVIVPFEEKFPRSYTLIPKKSKNGTTVTLKGHPGWTVAYQSIGPWTMIVIRDAKRHAVDCYLHVTQHHFMDLPDVQTLTLHDLLDGVYEGPDGKKAVFGPLLDHYTDLDYSRDPGIFSVQPDKQFSMTGTILYGDGRVSRGNPSSPKYGKMPGGGGAAAIMGPMEWQITPILGGLHVKVTQDEPFVLHSPDFNTKEFDLRRVQDPYADLSGIYSVASVRPLPKGMLRLLTKGDLLRMNKEVPDRHSDGSKLTDLELLNLDLINAVLNEQ